MNEYTVTVEDELGPRQVTVLAETARGAREQAEAAEEADVVAVRFERAVTFSCRSRNGRAPA